MYTLPSLLLRFMISCHLHNNCEVKSILIKLKTEKSFYMLIVLILNIECEL